MFARQVDINTLNCPSANFHRASNPLLEVDPQVHLEKHNAHLVPTNQDFWP